ncbi:phosphoribulokinase/uridine kinase [Methanofollis liminatans DSM 4140]|uniref:phosphoribulokinase n=1 Tax=Methanofollis liminatans DSM 4140 TaxID=28892 RepID=J0SAT8_9EURY|nr:phosphoribulokinase [Methanofollis liminatans]EJG07799.1 phosphoribulokinase/uridine kinase [Methanofollis liminatans DSM 4140]
MDTPVFRDLISGSNSVFVIGVAGDSGSGKTTFTRAIREIVGADLVATITLDDYHRYDRKERKDLGITPLVPEANNLDLLADHIRALKSGNTVMKPVYNHSDGTFDPPIPFRPARVLILEGLHTLFTPELRSLLDFSLFVDPDPAVKTLWKIRRDMQRRGYSRAEVLAEMEERKPDYERYIAPQRAYADAVIRIACSGYGEEASEERNVYRVTILQKKLLQQMVEIGLSIDLGEIFRLCERPFLLEFGLSSLDGRELSALVLDGELAASAIRRLARTIGRETRSEAVNLFADRQYVTAGEIAELILAWRILNRWHVLEAARSAHAKG